MSANPMDVPESWPVLSSEVVFSEWVIDVRKDVITRPEGGESFSRLVVDHPGAAIVFALDDEFRVLVLRQYRHGVQHRMVQLPAGVIDGAGEDPLDVAQRELREEAQFAAASWTPMLDYFVSPGITNERYSLFLARDLTPVDRGDFELQHEEIDLVPEWIRFVDLLDDVVSGRVRDGALINAVLAYNVMSRRGQL
ncbi:NUDIX hydrolase [Nocardioides sp.]|uniref:NUDIX domain-containing protein n=1 Tax=Nocardioides sp. TaxID=35761 RepID=UPI002635652D|nr:NUDIX hydrolase [Nocardioides sp.]